MWKNANDARVFPSSYFGDDFSDEWVIRERRLTGAI